MFVIVTCPECQKQLSVPKDLLGKNASCPDCRHAFVMGETTPGGREQPGNGSAATAAATGSANAEPPVVGPPPPQAARPPGRATGTAMAPPRPSSLTAPRPGSARSPQAGSKGGLLAAKSPSQGSPAQGSPGRGLIVPAGSNLPNLTLREEKAAAAQARGEQAPRPWLLGIVLTISLVTSTLMLLAPLNRRDPARDANLWDEITTRFIDNPNLDYRRRAPRLHRALAEARQAFTLGDDEKLRTHLNEALHEIRAETAGNSVLTDQQRADLERSLRELYPP